ncbi:MAG: hypothetical protein GC208_09505 [Alphaproteobacteria bacterium]|nr:hypothetical protein [Alphaproteobacteria bacterium]
MAGAEEIWRTVPSYPEYCASSLGRVRREAIVYGGQGSVRKPRGVLTARPLPLGHLQVTLSIGNKRITALVHRLVAEAFLPAPLPGQDCVLHCDDDPANNRPENLRWGTRQDNSADMVSKSRQARGEAVSSAKITPEVVRDIRRRAADSQKQRDIAETYGIAQSNVSSIVSGKTWGHVE